MKRLLHLCVLAVFGWSCFYNQVALAQNVVSTGPIETGFAVVTPLFGGGQGLSVSETLSEVFAGNVFQSSVLPAPLVTLTSVVANVNLNTGVNTGVALVNPNDSTANVTFSLRNGQGAVIAVRSLAIGGKQQVSRFVSELFAGAPELSEPITGLLDISTDTPVSVMGLTFNGPAFSTLPVATQLSANSIAAATDVNGAIIPATPIVVPQTIVFAQSTPITVTTTTATTNPSTAPLVNSAAFTTVPTGLTIPTGQITPIGLTTPTPITTATPTSTFTGQTPPPPTTTTASFQETPNAVTTVPFLILPQVATGGGWVSAITIANTSTVPQTVRVDVFNAVGGPFPLPPEAFVPSITVPAGGVVTISTF